MMRSIWDRADLRGLARANFKRFVASIFLLLREKNTHFDLILVGGNSGLAMARFTQMIYDYLGLAAPVVVKTYPQRYRPGAQETPENLVDNSILGLDLKSQLRDYRVNTNVRRILFVDDEIGVGHTARVCLELLLEAIGRRDLGIEYYIVAEDGGFKGFDVPEGMHIEFMPFAIKVEELNNIISYIPPYKIAKPLRGIFQTTSDEEKIILNVLLDLPSRDKQISLDGFSLRDNWVAKQKVTSLRDLQDEFRRFIRQLIKDGIEEYQTGKLHLDDLTYISQFIGDE